ncbi:MAG: hypothetical protein AAGF53_02945 [Pseudomonadota bacterium]
MSIMRSRLAGYDAVSSLFSYVAVVIALTFVASNAEAQGRDFLQDFDHPTIHEFNFSSSSAESEQKPIQYNFPDKEAEKYNSRRDNKFHVDPKIFGFTIKNRGEDFR